LSLASANAGANSRDCRRRRSNTGDRPYIASSPSVTPEVISVAQTQVPSAKRYPLVINSPAENRRPVSHTESIGWAPIDTGFTGEVVYVGRGCEGDAYLANPAGKVALIDRGACNVSPQGGPGRQGRRHRRVDWIGGAGDPISFAFAVETRLWTRW